MIEISRGYNLNVQGKDNNREEDAHTCSSGSFNKLFYILQARHSLVDIPVVDKEMISAKANVLIKGIISSCFLRLPEEVQGKYLSEWKEKSAIPLSFIDAYLSEIQKPLEEALEEEFGAFREQVYEYDVHIKSLLQPSTLMWIDLKEPPTLPKRKEQHTDALDDGPSTSTAFLSRFKRRRSTTPTVEAIPDEEAAPSLSKKKKP